MKSLGVTQYTFQLLFHGVTFIRLNIMILFYRFKYRDTYQKKIYFGYPCSFVLGLLKWCNIKVVYICG